MKGAPMNKHPTANYRIVLRDGEASIHFFCDLSGALVCTVKAAPGQTEPVPDAWEREGKQHFSQCRRCGRWSCDAMYNPDTLQCVDCSPWEEQPAFCPQCGAKVSGNEMFCRRCHVRLRYGEEVETCEGTD